MATIRSWKKVLENDLDYLASELREVVEKPAAIILSGPVGVGKTTFTKRFVKDTPIQSPTYSVINEAGEIAHADFYRIKDPQEIIHLELPLYLEDKEFFLIEWGMPFVREIARSLDEHFSLYELEIEVNADEEKKEPSASRNFCLKKLDKI